MNRTLLAIPLAAVLAVSMITTPMAFAAPGYTNVRAHTILAQTSGYTYIVVTSGRIPTTADAYINDQVVFGYAWLDTSGAPTTIQAVVATIHPNFPTDSPFSDNDDWHGHTAVLGVENDHLCVLSLASPAFAIHVANNKLALTLSSDDATVTDPNAPATSFVLQGNAACTTTGIEVIAPAP